MKNLRILDSINVNSRNWFNDISEFHAIKEIIDALESVYKEAQLSDYNKENELKAIGKKEMFSEVIDFLKTIEKDL